MSEESEEISMSRQFEKEKYIEDSVNTVSNMLNRMGFDNEAFCKTFTQEHRTLQQNFTRLCVEWLRTCADASYNYDDRNLASHIVAKEIIDKEPIARPWYLPYI
jgi:hypothetical protein